VFTRWVYLLLLAAYAVALGVITLRALPETGGTSSWIPFVTIWRVLTESGVSSYFKIGSLVGNVALFVPLGWLLPMTWPQLRSLQRVLVAAAACSIAIELVQFAIPGRSPATDDVLLNTLGGLIGAIMFFAPRKAG
jgi:glycopeptide antibiotics resistance protein